MFVDLNALMICSIAIGLVVDDTMHFMYNYRKYYEKFGNAPHAVRETFLTTGRALLITALVLAANFFVLLSATFTSTHKFGFFTGFVILMALVADFIVAPALMVLVMPHLKLKKADSLVGGPTMAADKMFEHMIDQAGGQPATLSAEVSDRLR